MKVLIVKTSALGDVVHALPVLSWIKSADPSIEIDWLVEESFAAILDQHPLIGRIHRVNTKAWRKAGTLAALVGFWAGIKALRSEHYDIVLDLQGNSKSGLFTLFSGAQKRFGFDRAAVREWPNLLATNRKISLTEAQHHISERSLAVARAAIPDGKNVPLAGPLVAGQSEREAISLMLQTRNLGKRPLIILHYGTTWETKLWSLQNWSELARALARREAYDIVLTWGNQEEKEAAASICRASGDQAVIWPRGTLRELVALLERADLVVGGDTGPVHIAAAVGTPTVSLYRVTDAQRNGPRGPLHRCLQVPLECAACLRKQCPRQSECAEAISADQVLDAIDDAFAKNSSWTDKKEASNARRAIVDQ
ncbi:lipopolysaccharide heptosyltransferase I [Geoalkalibacter subterraneus]|uniref:Lipopolysaccharide heptosyltransferase 1 n=1 Tax=Geoalkalibacter subterraneus TaxID=483547 RepID=A0A0B5FHN8_9BACT|nr:lipopolysaccharide heptosyltransferase I [Geoalkalibacter subterraneus]AJF06883.1 lipopolysaccharide heptosyltransferase [Geoalkalibacter subterraneus]